MVNWCLVVILPWQAIWKTSAPLKVSFFVCCMTQGKILTIDNLILRQRIMGMLYV